MNFLPDNYIAPKSSNFYMKIQEGENRIRILTRPVFGWEDWQDKKPLRFEFDKKPAKPIDPKKPIKHFWAFIVYNYAEEQIQIMHITQASIRKSIEALCNDKDWGAPFSYDIKIKKIGEGMNTEYSVNPIPHKPIDPSIIAAFKERPCDLEALFTGEDPFTSKKYTPMGVDSGIDKVSKVEEIPVKKVISQAQVSEIMNLIALCDEAYGNRIFETLKKAGIHTVYEIPEETYQKMYPAVKKHKEEYQASLQKKDENAAAA